MSVGLYMDVHVPQAVTDALRTRGIDVMTAQDDGAREVEDSILLARCTRSSRILVSQDKDLLRIGVRAQRTGTDFRGIVYGHQLLVTIGQMIEDLELLAKTTDLADWQQRIEYLPLR